MAEPARIKNMPRELIRFTGVGLVYPGSEGNAPLRALVDIDLSVDEGEFVSLIGPSGCGKSTLLRIASDLLAPTRGEVSINRASARETRLARRIGFVFQEAALLEWRNILDNVALPLELQGVARAERHETARSLMKMVGLQGFERVRPDALSGGMRQRAAIARAMSTRPDVLMMDEPFGALDQITRDRLNLELIGICEQTRVTVLFVTHSIREAVLLSDRVVVMTPRPGRISRVIPIDLPRPRTLATRDADAFAALVRDGGHELEQGYGDDADER